MMEDDRDSDEAVIKEETNDELMTVQASESAIVVRISSPEDSLVFDVAAEDNIDFIKENIVTELGKRGRQYMLPDIILTQNGEILKDGSASVEAVANRRGEVDLKMESPSYVKKQRTLKELSEVRRKAAQNAIERLKNCLLLQKNFEACIDASQTNTDPSHRKIVQNAPLEVKDEPFGRDLGYLVRDMANSIRTWAFQLEHLSDQLIKDELVNDKTSTDYQKARRLIQNNMDAARYLSPQLQHFCQFVVPLGDEPPRKLSVLPSVVKDSLKH